MTLHELLGLFGGVTGLGLLHGLEPGHGWPVAAAWALARPRPWRSGVLAACVIGIGHLVSSIAVVVLFFVAKSWFDFGDSPWVDWVAGALLLSLAAWQLSSLRGHGHHHHHDDTSIDASTDGLWALTLFAFTLGFAHEEEFQIIAMCAGSGYCLSLMLVYAAAVIAALVALTLILIAGLAHFRHRIEHAQRRLTLASAIILALMGVGFLLGLF